MLLLGRWGLVSSSAAMIKIVCGGVLAEDTLRTGQSLHSVDSTAATVPLTRVLG